MSSQLLRNVKLVCTGTFKPEILILQKCDAIPYPFTSRAVRFDYELLLEWTLKNDKLSLSDGRRSGVFKMNLVSMFD